MIDNNETIIVFGKNGLLGSAIVRQLKTQGYTNILTPDSKTLNLLDKDSIEAYVAEHSPAGIFMVAGLVGGILGNKKRGADFLYENTTMILNLLEAIRKKSSSSKIVYTGSTCIYPKENPQPINEDRFLAGKLEESNIGYAIAKSTGVLACQLYRQQYNLNTVCAMPTNLYGPGDNYDLENGHMLAALIKKFILAKKNNTELHFWGTGTPRREALYSDDCANALIHLMNHYDDSEIVNIGTGFDYSIKEYVEILEREIGYTNTVHWDNSKPDGTLEKRTDITRLKHIYPQYSPRSFQEGLALILSNEQELERIHE